ncbi:hypothetical protein ACWKWP_04775 [Agromyces soli]
MSRRWVPAVAGAALLVTAWGVAALTPDEEAAEQPFVVQAPIGERGEGRNLAVAVLGVRAADAVVNGGWSAEGEWLVVDLEAEAVQSDIKSAFNRVSLDLGDRRYQASERPPDSLFEQPLSVGVPLAGSVAFELPRGALAELQQDDPGAELVLRFGLERDDRLDSVIETRVPLDGLERIDEAEIAASDWAGA